MSGGAGDPKQPHQLETKAFWCTQWPPVSLAGHWRALSPPGIAEGADSALREIPAHPAQLCPCPMCLLPCASLPRFPQEPSRKKTGNRCCVNLCSINCDDFHTLCSAVLHTHISERAGSWLGPAGPGAVPAMLKLQGTPVPLGQVAGVCPGCHSTFYRLISVEAEA